ncbi:Nucleobindin-1 [Geodia barretti]|uniref:Nucleobindin-1 n=1 Tax=Geodia barretti TaxID=519541 RepID=A0AA35T790_GEOBA|nr:Nucleobindin-1 [Geodia barretti]
MTVAGVILVVFLAGSASALPVDPRLDRQAGGGYLPPDRPVYADEAGKVRRPRFPDTPGLDQDEYNRYWQEMVKENPAMLEHLKKGLDPEQLPMLHPRVSERMARSSDGVRNRLEEARRMNIDELRELQRLQQSLQEQNRRFSPDSEWVAKNQALRDALPEHYDADDIRKRMAEQRRVLEEIDRKRREEYEQYQLQLEHQRREKLKAMNEEQRLQAERALEEAKEKQKQHEKMYKPASKHQLEEVWEEDDGLKDEKFDPKTFFFLHVYTSEPFTLCFLDILSRFKTLKCVLACFLVKKAYGKNIDNMEMQEELARMREYALKQLDKNGDSLISLQEFLAYTQGAQFEDNEEWKGVVDQPESFTEEEMNKFEEGYEDYYDYDYDKDGNIIGFKTRSRETSKSTDKHPPQEQEPPAPEGGVKEMKGDPGADEHRGPPTHRVGEVDSHQQQQKQQPEGRNEGVPAGGGQVVEGVPGQHQDEHGQEGVPAAGTQREGQAQQFNKNNDHPAPGHQ